MANEKTIVNRSVFSLSFGKGSHRSSLLRKKNLLIISILLMALSVVLAAFVSHAGFKGGVILLAGIFSIAMVAGSVINERFGFFLLVILPFFLFDVQRLFPALPVSAITTLLTITTFIGILVKKIIHKDKSWAYANNPITYIFLILYLYLALQAFNPSATSISGWFHFFYLSVIKLIFYFIALHVFKNMKTVILFIKCWFILAVVAAIYGCYQHWFGLPGYSNSWLYADMHRFKLYYQGGSIRVFSFLSDPTIFGMLMASSALFFIILGIGPHKMRGRIVLFSGVIFMLLSMAYTGTRTATAMIPAGIIMFGLLTINNKKTLVLLIISVMAYGILVYGPFYGSTARRLRSTFYPEHDASFNVRDYNRHRIQPYIYSHPIGGGLATVGVPGEEYSPHHPLAGFPPDNGYLATVLETGWIGLIIYLTEMFIILTLAVCNYYRARDREIRNLYAGIIAFIFMWIVAQYGQSAIGRYTHNAVYTPVLALIVVLRYFDQKISSDKTGAMKIKEGNKIKEDVSI